MALLCCFNFLFILLIYGVLFWQRILGCLLGVIIGYQIWSVGSFALVFSIVWGLCCSENFQKKILLKISGHNHRLDRLNFKINWNHKEPMQRKRPFHLYDDILRHPLSKEEILSMLCDWFHWNWITEGSDLFPLIFISKKW